MQIPLQKMDFNLAKYKSIGSYCNFFCKNPIVLPTIPIVVTSVNGPKGALKTIQIYFKNSKEQPRCLAAVVHIKVRTHTSQKRANKETNKKAVLKIVDNRAVNKKGSKEVLFSCFFNDLKLFCQQKNLGKKSCQKPKSNARNFICVFCPWFSQDLCVGKMFAKIAIFAILLGFECSRAQNEGGVANMAAETTTMSQSPSTPMMAADAMAMNIGSTVGLAMAMSSTMATQETTIIAMEMGNMTMTTMGMDTTNGVVNSSMMPGQTPSPSAAMAASPGRRFGY